MYINRALLLIAALAFVFAPAVQDWVSNDQAPWYRAYIIWAVLITIAYLGQRGRYHDDI